MGLVSLLNIPVALSFLAVIFMAIGFGVPMWISLSDNIHLGLWNVLICVDDECDNASFDSNAIYKDIDEDDLFVAIRVVHSIVLAMAVLGWVILIFIRCQLSLSKKIIASTCFLFAVSGIGMLITIGLFLAFHMDNVAENRIVTALNFPWSMLMSGIGGFFAIACGFALMVIYRSGYWHHTRYYDDYQDKHGYDNRRYDEHSSHSDRHHNDHHSHHKAHHEQHHDHHPEHQHELHDHHHDHHPEHQHELHDHHHHDDHAKRHSPYHENHYHSQAEPAREPHYIDNMYRPYGLNRY